MKHIVHVSNDFEPISGGVNTHLKNLLQCLGENSFKVTLLVPTASNAKRADITVCKEGGTTSFRVVRSPYQQTDVSPLKWVRLTGATEAGLHWIREHIGEIDLVHQHDRRATRQGATSFASKENIPVIWTNHSPDYFGKNGWMTRTISKIQNQTPDGVIAVHRSMAELLRRSEFSDIPVRYIPNGVNTNHFMPDGNCETAKTVVLFPQRLIPSKGPEILAKAAYRILHNYQNKDLSFWFAGSEIASNRDKQSIRKVKEILNDFTDTDAVRFLDNPSYEEMPWYYSCADIVVLPLQVETENLSVFEAWSSGVPLITTYQVEKNGYMIDEENCLIVPDKDVRELAETILRLLLDKNLRDKLAKNGRTLVENHFRWADAAVKTAQFYDEILKRHRG